MTSPFVGVWQTVRYQTQGEPAREAIVLTVSEDSADSTRLDGSYAAPGFDGLLHGAYDSALRVWTADIREGSTGTERLGQVIFALSDDGAIIAGAYAWSNIGVSAPLPWWGVRP